MKLTPQISMYIVNIILFYDKLWTLYLFKVCNINHTNITIQREKNPDTIVELTNKSPFDSQTYPNFTLKSFESFMIASVQLKILTNMTN